jgi:hypothetical protein
MTATTISDRDQLNRIHAEAIRLLIDWTELDVALALGRATLTRIEHEEEERVGISFLDVYLTAESTDRPLLEEYSTWMIGPNGENNGPAAIQGAFGQTSGLDDFHKYPTIYIGAPDAEVQRHQGTTREPGKYEYRGLRYRSKTEIRVAEALDNVNVLYFPLPLGVRHFMRIAEPDFLIVHMGRIGVLEIDGPHHTPLTRAQESAKDAKLIQSGVRIVHHVAVSDVDLNVDAVVREFLALLRGPIL